MKNKRNYGNYLSIQFPNLEQSNKNKFYNDLGIRIDKITYNKIIELKEKIKELTEMLCQLTQELKTLNE